MTQEIEYTKTDAMIEVERRIGEPLEGYIKKQYADKKTQEEIGELCNVSQTLVGKWMKDLKIEIDRKKMSKWRAEKMRRKMIKDIEGKIGMPLHEYLHRENHDKKRSLESISESLNICTPTVSNLFAELEIPIKRVRKVEQYTRQMIEAQKKLGVPLEDYIRKEYRFNEVSQSELARNLDVSTGTIDNWIERFKIPKKIIINKLSNLDYAVKVAKRIKKMYGLENLPNNDNLEENGFGRLARAIIKKHGGYHHFREILGEEQDRRHGFFNEMTDEMLIEYVKERYNGISISEISSKDPTLVGKIREKKLTRKLSALKIIKEKKRKNRFFSNFTNNNLRTFVSKNYKGWIISKVEDEDASLINELRDRKQIDLLVNKGILVKSFNPGYLKNMNNEEIIKYTSENFKGKIITQVENIASGLVATLRQRGILEEVINRGIIIRKMRSHAPYGNMNDSSFIQFVKDNYSKQTLTDVHKKNKTAYREIKKRKLDEKLVNESILIRKESISRGYYKSWENFERGLKEVISKLGHFPTQRELKDAKKLTFTDAAQRYHGGIYLVKKKMGYSSKIDNYDNLTDEEIVNHIKSDCSGIKLSIFRSKKKCAYNVAVERNLLPILFDNKIVIDNTSEQKRSFKKLDNTQFIDYVSRNYSRQPIGRLSELDSGVYNEICRRNLADYLVENNILIRVRTRESDRKYGSESLLEGYVYGLEGSAA